MSGLVRGARMGVDVGSVRVGLASSDPDGLIATPVETLARAATPKEPGAISADVAQIAREVAERGAQLVYVGLPRHLKGTEGAASAAARDYAATLARTVAPVEVRMVDERMTSVTAHQALHASGRAGRKHRAVVDQVAAVVILQSALDAERASGRRAGGSRWSSTDDTPETNDDEQGGAHAVSDLFSSPEQPNVERRAAAPAAAPMTRAQSRNNPVARRRRRARRIRTTIIVVVTLALVGGAGYFVMKTVPGFFAKESVSEDYAGPGSGEVQVQIAKGASGAAIGAALAEAGVIKTQAAFTQAIKDYTAANGSEPNLQYGTYNLMKEMSAAGALSAMLDKSNLVQDGVTVREGLTIEATIERLASVTAIPAADFEKALEDPEALGLPKEADGDVEGWLAPARYPFTNDSTAEQILSTMIAKQVSDLNDLGVKLKDAKKVLTKASLVEAEAPADGRGKVARVIENRLATDEALRFDSTIHYLAGERTSNATTTAEQREIDSPYNTYKHTGLPPGPINSPGRASIEAVLDPPEGNWLFFVTVNPTTGETCFTETFAQHQECVAQYQQWLRDNPVTKDPEDEE